jgi:integrase
VRKAGPKIIERPIYESIETAIQQFRPDAKRCPNFKLYEDAARDIIRRTNPSTPCVVTNLAVPLCQLIEWALDQGMDLDLDRILRPDSIERFVRVGMPRLSEDSRLNRHASLKRIGRVGAPDWWKPKGPSGAARERLPPYSDGELRKFWMAADHQLTPLRRRFFRAVMTLCLGAGLKAMEVAMAHPNDVTERDGIVTIRTHYEFDTPRTIPFRDQYVPQLKAMMAANPNEPFVGDFEVRRHGLLARMQVLELPGKMPPLQASRLRQTWMVSLLDDNVDVPTFMLLAGITATRALGDLFPYLTPQPHELSWAKAAGRRHG